MRHVDVYYNDHDAGACAWLRELIKDGQLTNGVVDARSITDIQPAELVGFTRVHMFAGIGGWDYALRLAGWPADRPVWTGSCPCQPFSAAGKGLAEKDPRHLWPEFRRLIAECRPPSIFGEQVASAAGRLWLARVRADLEELGYAVGAADLCAASLGAPHIRQRLYWVAYAECAESRLRISGEQGEAPAGRGHRPAIDGTTGRLADAGCSARWTGTPSGCGDARGDSDKTEWTEGATEASACGSIGGMGDANGAGCEARNALASSGGTQPEHACESGSSFRMGDPTSGGCRECGHEAQSGDSRHAQFAIWSRFDLVPCRDGKSRRVESGSFPLVDGFPGRVGLLRGYGNAIVPEVAAEFIRAACMETVHWGDLDGSGRVDGRDVEMFARERIVR